MTEVKKKNKNIIKRSLARLVAVQVLYQYDFFKHDKDISFLKDKLLDDYVLDENDDNGQNISYRNKVDLKFLEKLTLEIALVLPKLDEKISQYLKGEWTIDKLPDIMLAILRLAIFELEFMKNIPLKVIINEYVDIAGSFYDAKKVTFVNGILDKIAQNRHC